MTSSKNAIFGPSNHDGHPFHRKTALFRNACFISVSSHGQITEKTKMDEKKDKTDDSGLSRDNKSEDNSFVAAYDAAYPEMPYNQALQLVWLFL